MQPNGHAGLQVIKQDLQLPIRLHHCNVVVWRWQVTGSVKITEFASVNDEDEYLFEVTTDLEKQKYGPLLAAIGRLKPDFLKQLRVYVKELNAL